MALSHQQVRLTTGKTPVEIEKERKRLNDEYEKVRTARQEDALSNQKG